MYPLSADVSRVFYSNMNFKRRVYLNENLHIKDFFDRTGSKLFSHLY